MKNRSPSFCYRKTRVFLLVDIEWKLNREMPPYYISLYKTHDWAVIQRMVYYQPERCHTWTKLTGSESSSLFHSSPNLPGTHHITVITKYIDAVNIIDMTKSK